MSEIDTLDKTEQGLTTSSDSANAAHYVISPDPKESNHSYVMRARIEGFPVTAICGFTWVPSRMATGLPVCQECRAIYELLPDTGGGDPKE